MLSTFYVQTLTILSLNTDLILDFIAFVFLSHNNNLELLGQKQSSHSAHDLIIGVMFAGSTYSRGDDHLYYKKI